MILAYIEKNYGFKVHTSYIAEMNRSMALQASNAVEELKQPRKHPIEDKVKAIKEALQYYKVIDGGINK